MSGEAYPIIVNPNPAPPKQKPKILSVKLFLALILVLIASASSWYLIQNKPWQKKVILEDSTTKEQFLQTHKEVWAANFKFDTTRKKAFIVDYPKISSGDLFASVITTKPALKEDEWGFEVTLEDKEGKILYRSYRIMPIFAKEGNPTFREFAIAIPYTSGTILRIFDLEENQLFAKEI